MPMGGARGGHALAEEQEFLGHARAHHVGVGEVLDAGDAHLDHRVREEGVVRREDEVARPSEHQPAGDARALHHGDRRLGNVAPAAAHAEVELLLADEEVLRASLVGVVPREGRDALEGLVDVAPGVPMSWPAEKCLPAPARTMTLTASSSTARMNASSSA